MRIELLPIWKLPDSSPAFYDVQSVTVTQAIAKLYPKMNELIGEYNKFAEEWNSKITEFEFSTMEELNTFKVSMRQEFQDFIDVINVKVKVLQETFNSDDETLNGILERLKALEDGGSGGSSKLYRHVVSISYAEYYEDFDPYFTLKVVTYRSSDNPITFDDLTNEDLINVKSEQLVYLGNDNGVSCGVPLIYCYKANGMLTLRCIDTFIDPDYGYSLAEGDYSPDKLNIEDVVTEV